MNERTIYTNDGGSIVLDITTGNVIRTTPAKPIKTRKPVVGWLRQQRELADLTNQEKVSS